jgi:cyclopropane-fatty-acyl-phospholipid synthase
MSAESNLHYDESVELFESFLDPYMKYTACLFDHAEEPIEAAAVRMLDAHVEAAGVREGARVLEIGTGWGSVLRRLRETRHGFDYTGINPSGVQQAYIAQRVDPAARLVTGRFEDVMGTLEGPYDAIFMIGCLCHIAEKERVLRGVAELLAPEGTVVLEDTFFLSEELLAKHQSRPETRFVQREVFGFAHVDSLGRHFDTVRAAGLQVMTTRNVSDHYAQTIDVWTGRLRALDPVRFPLAEQFVRYMGIFQRGWGHTISEQVMTLKKLRRWRSSQ